MTRECLQGGPDLVVADEAGAIFELPELCAAVECGRGPEPCPDSLWMPLPPGSDLFLLPGRTPIGLDRRTGDALPVPAMNGRLSAVAAFVAPAHTILRHPAWRRESDAPRLPLYAYCAVGWKDGGFCVPAVRIDRDIRQELSGFDCDEIERRAEALLAQFPHNRLAAHLVNNCVRRYGCPAARNFTLGRWEMPLPTAAACNSRCIGCISLQPDGDYPVTQERIDFVPTVEEIVELAVPHLLRAERPVASFGQGCEGEPLANPRLLISAVRKIRKRTDRGTLNLNTNASDPDAVAALFDAGLDSIRVSINSALPERYDAYYRPVNYRFEDVARSLALAAEKGRWASINYLVFPGVTDTPRELEALSHLIQRTKLSMIQWRNLNIDPDDYRALMAVCERPIGMENLLAEVARRHPGVRFGYFNPCLSPQPA
ncbi:radical SAM protein [bacterium]|nr:radical SAM protein [bacterium]